MYLFFAKRTTEVFRKIHTISCSSLLIFKNENLSIKMSALCIVYQTFIWRQFPFPCFNFHQLTRRKSWLLPPTMFYESFLEARWIFYHQIASTLPTILQQERLIILFLLTNSFSSRHSTQSQNRSNFRSRTLPFSRAFPWVKIIIHLIMRFRLGCCRKCFWRLALENQFGLQVFVRCSTIVLFHQMPMIGSGP